MDNDSIRVVEQARDFVKDESRHYNYADWRRCAAGHTFRAATGEFAENGANVTNRTDPRFQKVMIDINAAISPFIPDGETSVHYLSVKASPEHWNGGNGPVSGCSPEARKAAVKAFDDVIKQMKRKDRAHDTNLVA